MNTYRVGVMYGSFNPVHLGHIATMKLAKHLFDLDTVWMVPVQAAPTKRRHRQLSPIDKYKLCQIARSGLEWLNVHSAEALNVIHIPMAVYMETYCNVNKDIAAQIQPLNGKPVTIVNIMGQDGFRAITIVSNLLRFFSPLFFSRLRRKMEGAEYIFCPRGIYGEEVFKYADITTSRLPIGGRVEPILAHHVTFAGQVQEQIPVVSSTLIRNNLASGETCIVGLTQELETETRNLFSATCDRPNVSVR